MDLVVKEGHMEVTTQWQDNCLTVPVNTSNGSNSLYETLTQAHTVASTQSAKEGWATIFQVNEETTISSLDHLSSLFDFETWAKDKGCVSLAIVMPEAMLDNYEAITPLLQLMHKRARVFFNLEDAQQWSIEMKQARRRELLH